VENGLEGPLSPAHLRSFPYPPPPPSRSDRARYALRTRTNLTTQHWRRAGRGKYRGPLIAVDHRPGLPIQVEQAAGSVDADGGALAAAVNEHLHGQQTCSSTGGAGDISLAPSVDAAGDGHAQSDVHL